MALKRVFGESPVTYCYCNIVLLCRTCMCVTSEWIWFRSERKLVSWTLNCQIKNIIAGKILYSILFNFICLSHASILIFFKALTPELIVKKDSGWANTYRMKCMKVTRKINNNFLHSWVRLFWQFKNQCLAKYHYCIIVSIIQIRESVFLKKINIKTFSRQIGNCLTVYRGVPATRGSTKVTVLLHLLGFYSKLTRQNVNQCYANSGFSALAVLHLISPAPAALVHNTGDRVYLTFLWLIAILQYGCELYEIITFLVILTFHLELGESTQLWLQVTKNARAPAELQSPAHSTNVNQSNILYINQMFSSDFDISKILSWIKHLLKVTVKNQ